MKMSAHINAAYAETDDVVEKSGIELRQHGASTAGNQVDRILMNIHEHYRKISVIDPAPNIDHYKLDDGDAAGRPTLQELHQSKEHQRKQQDGRRTTYQCTVEGIEAQKLPTTPVKFGWLIGVLIRCFLSILGGLLYLRIGWVAGQAGVGLATLIILLSSFVATLTALSMCAICTNGEVKAGGAYFLISRSLGPEFGGSVGIVFAFANALTAALNIVAFAETCKDWLKDRGYGIIDQSDNDIRVIGLTITFILMCVVLVGVDFEIKAQMVLLVILLVSFVNYIVGTLLPPTISQQAKGFIGYQWQTFVTNFGPDFRDRESFFTVFSVYFPAATGIMAGANISGNLKDPSHSIPKGTLWAIFLSTFIYASALWMAAATCLRDATGYFDFDNTTNETIIFGCFDENYTGTCDYGLINYFQTMEMQSAFGLLITAGIFAATLSSSLAAMVSGPKLFQAVGRDMLFPKIDWFAKGYGKSDEPKRACFLFFFITLAIVSIANLNYIAPYISNFYLATYALINYACFHGSMVQATGWRPSFKYYNKWLSFLGAIICVGAMFLMSYIGAICTAIFIVALYAYLRLKNPHVNWGTSKQAEIYKTALEVMLKLLYTEEHVKNYRPQILAMTGNPVVRPQMLDIVKSITKQKGLVLLGHVVYHQPDPYYYKYLKTWRREVYAWLRYRRVKAFYCPVAANTLKDGLQTLLQTAGLGKLTPNMVVFGFKHDWQTAKPEETTQYFQMIHEVLDCELSIGVLKVGTGFDCSSEMLDFNPSGLETAADADVRKSTTECYDATLSKLSPPLGVIGKRLSAIMDDPDANDYFDDTSSMSPSSNLTLADEITLTSLRIKYESRKKSMALAPSEEGHFDCQIRKLSRIRPETLQEINQFQHRAIEPVIHVYWLSDDGGLTLLIPHILATNNTFMNSAKLRIFTVANKTSTPVDDEKNMRILLRKFRIEFADVTIITDMHAEPAPETKQAFQDMIRPFQISKNVGLAAADAQFYITDDELAQVSEKTRQHLRTRELLTMHSQDASMIVITQPIPRKGAVSACLYLAWLDFMTKSVTNPVMFIRGNQQSVLTFYS